MSAFPRVKVLDITRTRINYLPIYYFRTEISEVRWPSPSCPPPMDDLVATRRVPLAERSLPCRSLESYCLTVLFRRRTPTSRFAIAGYGPASPYPPNHRLRVYLPTLR